MNFSSSGKCRAGSGKKCTRKALLESARAFASRRRGRLALSAAVGTALLATCSVSTVHAVNTTFTVTSTGTANESTASYTIIGTATSETAPSSSDAGKTLRYNNASTALTLTLDQPVTLGAVLESNAGSFTLSPDVNSDPLTLDGTGLLAASQAFGDAGVAEIVDTALTATSPSNTFTVNTPIALDTNVDIGAVSTGTVAFTGGLIVGGSITAANAVNVNFHDNGMLAPITVSGNIGASGSNITINNLGIGLGSTSAGTVTLTLNGVLGSSVASVTQSSGASAFVLSGANTYAGTTTLAQGNLIGIRSTFSATQTPFGSSTFDLNGGTLSLLFGGVTGGPTGNSTAETVTLGNNVVVNANVVVNQNTTATATSASHKTLALNNLTIGANTLETVGNNSYVLQFAGSTTLTGNAVFFPNTNVITLTGAIGDGGNNFGFSKFGLNMTISGENTYTGATYVQGNPPCYVPRRGGKRAIIAVGHSQLCIACHMLKDGTSYNDLGVDYFVNRDTDRAKDNLVNRLQKMGFALTLTPKAA
jgi:fibronectin-binding autotransporter adhesin